MKEFDNYALVEPHDIQAVREWVKTSIVVDDRSNSEKVQNLELIKNVIMTCMSYAEVIANDVGGLAMLAEDLAPAQRSKALADAAKRMKGKGGKR